MDLEWEDNAALAESQLDGGAKEAAASEALFEALRWARVEELRGKMASWLAFGWPFGSAEVMVNCAEGRSRSATFAIVPPMLTSLNRRLRPISWPRAERVMRRPMPK